MSNTNAIAIPAAFAEFISDAIADNAFDANAMNAIYRDGDNAIRGAIRVELDAQMRNAIANGDSDAALMFIAMRDALSARAIAIRPEIDHRAIVIRALAEIHNAGIAVMEYAMENGVEFADDDEIGNAIDDFDVDSDRVSAIAKMAIANSGNRAPRGNVGAHIAYVIANANAFMTCTEITNAISPEYPNGAHSVGAIAARLFPANGNCTVSGVIPVLHDPNNANSARGAIPA